MTRGDLVAREIAQRKTLIDLLLADPIQSTPATRLAMKICREDLRATRSEIRKLRKPA